MTANGGAERQCRPRTSRARVAFVHGEVEGGGAGVVVLQQRGAEAGAEQVLRGRQHAWGDNAVRVYPLITLTTYRIKRVITQ